MSFLKGSFSAQRFSTDKLGVTTEYEDVINFLTKFNFNRTREDAEGVLVGWGGGDHELDGEITCEKNLRGEFLHFAFRVTQFKPPASKVKAYYQMELKGIMAANEATWATREMRAEAREAAQAKIEEEGKDGRYLKHTVIPIVWDGKTGQVWYGSSSHTHWERFVALFSQTFGIGPVLVTAGQMANQVADKEEEITPSFGESPAWCPDGWDWLGNEFGMWLLYDSQETNRPHVVISKKLTVACPEGLCGTDTFTSEFPAGLPEFYRAMQDGRLPRAIGIILNLQTGDPVQFTLDPELWTVSGVKLPEIEDVEEGQQKDVARLEQCRSLFESLDGLFEKFMEIRLSDDWAGVVERINHWTGRVPAEVS